MVREIGTPLPPHGRHSDQFVGFGKIDGLVVEAGGDLPGTLGKVAVAGHLHPPDLVRGRSAVLGSRRVRRGRVEADIKADVFRQAVGGKAGQLFLCQPFHDRQRW